MLVNVRAMSTSMSTSMATSMTASRDPLVALRLRRAARRLPERAHDRAAGEWNLEVVPAEAARAAQQRVGGAREALGRRRLAFERVLGIAVAPRLVGDAA